VNPAAEYGWKPGTIVNVGLKSGTNTLHGTGYAFGRDTPLDARNYFNTVASGPQESQKSGAVRGTAGGALVKDKVFFFRGYEGQRYTVGNHLDPKPRHGRAANASNCTFIASGDCTNSLTDAIADVQAAGINREPRQPEDCGCTAAGVCDGTGFPTNDGTNPNGPSSIINGFPNTVSADNFIAKADVHLNDRNSVTGMYFYGNNNGTVEDFPELQPKWQSLIHTRAQVVGGSWTFFPNSRWVNEARFGYNRLYQPSLNKDHAVDPAAAYGLNTGCPFLPLSGGLPRIGWFGEFQAVGGFKCPSCRVRTRESNSSITSPTPPESTRLSSEAKCIATGSAAAPLATPEAA